MSEYRQLQAQIENACLFDGVLDPSLEAELFETHLERVTGCRLNLRLHSVRAQAQAQGRTAP